MKKRMRTAGIWVVLVLLVVFLLQEGESRATSDRGVAEVHGVVVGVDNSELVRSGIGYLGSQDVTVLLTSGPFKGEQIEANNSLIGSLEIDEVYAPGDATLVALKLEGGSIGYAKMLNQNRQGGEAALFGVFVLLLLIYAGMVGLKALLSFVASLLVFWKFLLPQLLAGTSPLLLTVVSLLLLTVVIIFLVAGVSRKAVAATLGTLAGLGVTLLLTLVFGDLLEINGLTAPFAATLVFSGHFDLDMRAIFYAAVVIGASGAAMDIAMDVAASMAEVKAAKPDISARQLLVSGLSVGRAVVGTMTTTLLLAYSGGYLTMLMLFVSKDTSFVRILNFKMVAAEIFRTLVGSIGLVAVAPLTAIIAAWLYSLAVQDKRQPRPAQRADQSSGLVPGASQP